MDRNIIILFLALTEPSSYRKLKTTGLRKERKWSNYRIITKGAQTEWGFGGPERW